MPIINRRSIHVLAKNLLATKNSSAVRPAISSIRHLSDTGESNSIHFRRTSTPHPLASPTNTLKAKVSSPTVPCFDTAGNPLHQVSRACSRIEERNILTSFVPHTYSNLTLIQSIIITARRSSFRRPYRPPTEPHLD